MIIDWFLLLGHCGLSYFAVIYVPRRIFVFKLKSDYLQTTETGLPTTVSSSKMWTQEQAKPIYWGLVGIL